MSTRPWMGFLRWLVLGIPFSVTLSCEAFDPLHPYDLPPLDTSVTWQKSIGGSGEDVGCSVQQASDGGFIITGYTNSFGAGDFDAWLVRTDASGNTLWAKTFGGLDEDRAYSGAPTPDGGHVLVGSSRSFGAGGSDVYLVKTDADGNELWHKTYGGADDQTGWCITCTDDGGYAMAGATSSNGIDAYVVKTDAGGNELWHAQYGYGRAEQANSIRQSADGGYILTGITEDEISGNQDVWLLKIDQDGNEQWSRTYGREYPDCGTAVEPTADGGYVLAGYTRSFGAGDFNAWLIKTDSSGTEEWGQTFGGDNDDRAECIQMAPEGGFVLAGMTRTIGWNQAWLIRTDETGALLWSKAFGGNGDEWGRGVQLTSDGGFILTGSTTSIGAGSIDAYLVYYKP